MSYLALTDEELAQLLIQDVPCGDLTTETVGIKLHSARLEFRARQEMVVCAIEEAARLFEINGAKQNCAKHKHKSYRPFTFKMDTFK